MDLADVENATSVICERKDAILRHTSTRMLFSLSVSFAERRMWRRIDFYVYAYAS